MNARTRDYLCALGALALLWLASPVGGQTGPLGRAVLVRVWAGDRFDPKSDIALQATTRSILEDQAWLADPTNKENAAFFLELEKGQGYSDKNLATMQEARLSVYLATNVPSNLCFCAGHVLVMAGNKVKSGPVPPVMMNAEEFYRLIKKFGTPRQGETQEGDVVAYYETEEKPIEKPDHVAWVVEGGPFPRVISKDAGQRTYIVGRWDIIAASLVGVPFNPNTQKKYRKSLVWFLPWERLRVQVVAGPIEFVGTPTVTPPEPAVGDTVTVAFDYRVSNSPSAGIRMQEDATLVDAVGNKTGPPQRKTQPLDPGPKLAGQSRSLVKRTSFQARVTKPVTHSWILELSPEKPTSMDEAAAEYMPVTKTVSFRVRARPTIADVKISVADGRIVEGGKGKISFGYTIKGVPEPSRPPLTVTIKLAHTSPVPDPSKPVTVSLLDSQSLLNSPSSEIVVLKEVPIIKAGSPGPRTITLTIKIEANGLPPAVETKVYSYEVVRRD